MNTSAIRQGLRPQNPQHEKRKIHLTFLRPENFLPPSHPKQTPVTAHQLQDLLKWSGNNQRAMATYLNCSLQSFRMWSKTSRSILDNKVIPPTIWHYMTILLGLKKQPVIRRVEPSTIIKHSYDIASNQPVNFRAIVNYHMSQISIFDDSDIPSVQGTSREPLAVIDVDFLADKEKEELTINGMYRSDSCPWQFGETTQLAKNLNDFLQNHIWVTCWRLHDWYSLQPSMFLKPKHLLPMTDNNFRVPDSTTLLRFCRWLGATPSDLAVLIWEKPDYMRFLVSSSANTELEEARERCKIKDGDSKAETSEKKKQLFNKTMRCRITPQGWQILLAATGLTPSIAVIGQGDPRPRHEKILSIKEVEGVPIEFVQIKCVSDWVDSTKSQVVITYQVSSHQKRGIEKKAVFNVENVRGILEIEGRMTEDGAPENWINTFAIEAKGYENEKDIINWFEKALWRYNWKFVNYHKLH